MPGGNGTGPRRGRSRGQMGGLFANGSGGNCVCPKCGCRELHIIGQPCNQKTCQKCGTRMTRE